MKRQSEDPADPAKPKKPKFATFLTPTFLGILAKSQVPEWVADALALLLQLRQEGRLGEEELDKLANLADAEDKKLQSHVGTFGHSAEEFLENLSKVI